MDYDQYFPPITLRQVFTKDWSPSLGPLMANLVFRREFSVDPAPNLKSTQESARDDNPRIALVRIEQPVSHMMISATIREWTNLTYFQKAQRTWTRGLPFLHQREWTRFHLLGDPSPSPIGEDTCCTKHFGGRKSLTEKSRSATWGDSFVSLHRP